MNTGLDTRPSAATYEMEKLVGMAWRGQIRVPHFQRDFRWNREDVVRLFDSIVKGFPVGSLLLWVRPAPAKRISLGALQIDAPRMDQALWVVDGQQRIISLANALHEDAAHEPRFALAYDLRENERMPGRDIGFVSRPSTVDPFVVPLPVLFDLRRVLKWFSTYPEAADYQDKAFNLTTLLRQYPVPAYQVEQENAEVLRDIFDRMNNYGKRLSRAEIFSALYAGDEEQHALTIDEVSAHIDEQLAFGRIDNDTVLYAILARRGHDVQREIRLEFDDNDRRGVSDFPGENRDTAYQAGEEAIRRAVEFLQRDAGVPHFTFLPFRYLLVVLARLFAHFPDPDLANRRLLRRWFWRAALVGPEIFRGSTTGAVRTLCAKIRPDDLTGSVQGLLSTVDRPAPPLPELRRFKTNEAAAKITLCAWWALEPRDPSSGELPEIGDLAECLIDRPTPADAVRYVVPSRLVDAKCRLWAANRALVPTMARESGKDIWDLFIAPPLLLDDSAWSDVLASHLISPHGVSLLRAGDVTSFLRTRQEDLVRDLAGFLQRMCEWGFENTPPLSELVIEDLLEDEQAPWNETADDSD